VQASGQLACQAVSGSADRCRVVRPHLGPMILLGDGQQLPGQLPAELPAKVVAMGRQAPSGLPPRSISVIPRLEPHLLRRDRSVVTVLFDR
jgi:hypothetical protein